MHLFTFRFNLLYLARISENTQLILANLINIESGLRKYRFSSNLSTPRYWKIVHIFYSINLFFFGIKFFLVLFSIRSMISARFGQLAQPVFSVKMTIFGMKTIFELNSNTHILSIIFEFEIDVHSNRWSWNCAIHFGNKIIDVVALNTEREHGQRL